MIGDWYFQLEHGFSIARGALRASFEGRRAHFSALPLSRWTKHTEISFEKLSAF
jgi:hypothetical protein